MIDPKYPKHLRTRRRALLRCLAVGLLPALLLAACGDDDATSSPDQPWQPGPFGVGVQQVTFTKKSATVPTQDRILPTDIWYPTEPNTGPIDSTLGGVVGAPRAAATANLPLVLFSHGDCTLPEMSTFFMQALASWGFIIAAPLDPGDLFTDPDCLAGPPLAIDAIANRVPDTRFVLDALLQLNGNPNSFLAGAINPNRIGMAGHSQGGRTTLLMSAVDQRVIAGLALAPGNPGGPSLRNIHTPIMAQGGTLDSIIPFDVFVQPIYNLLKPPKYLVEIAHTGHQAFLDTGCYPAVPTPICDATGPDALTADAAHQLILRYAVPFLLHWVAGDDRFDAFLAPDAAPPGVIVTTDTGGSSTSATPTATVGSP